MRMKMHKTQQRAVNLTCNPMRAKELKADL